MLKCFHPQSLCVTTFRYHWALIVRDYIYLNSSWSLQDYKGDVNFCHIVACWSTCSLEFCGEWFLHNKYSFPYPLVQGNFPLSQLGGIYTGLLQFTFTWVNFPWGNWTYYTELWSLYCQSCKTVTACALLLSFDKNHQTKMVLVLFSPPWIHAFYFLQT